MLFTSSGAAPRSAVMEGSSWFRNYGALSSSQGLLVPLMADVGAPEFFRSQMPDFVKTA